MHDELFNYEIFDNIFEAKILIEKWRKDYNTIRPHNSLSYRPPTPVTMYMSMGNSYEKSLSGL